MFRFHTLVSLTVHTSHHRRPSPYYTSFDTAGGGGGGGAGGGGVARVNSSKHFFSRTPGPASPCESAAGSAFASASAYGSTNSRAEFEGALLAQAASTSGGAAAADNGCRLSSSAETRMTALGRDPNGRDHPRPRSSSAAASDAAPSAKIKTTSSFSARDAQVGDARDVTAGMPRATRVVEVEAEAVGRPGVGASAAPAGVNGRSASASRVYGFPASPVSVRNSAKGSVTSTEEDFPPRIEALQMGQAAGGMGGGGGVEKGSRDPCDRNSDSHEQQC